MQIFTECLSLASHAIEIFREIDWPIKFPNRCKDQLLHPMMKNSSACYFYFTEIKTVDFVKRCLKISSEYHWIILPQQRCSWLNRLRSQFYLRERQRLNFLKSFSCERFLLSASTFFKKTLIKIYLKNAVFPRSLLWLCSVHLPTSA